MARTQKKPIPMPYYQIHSVLLPPTILVTSHGHWQSMIRFTANEYLDLTERVEEQNPDALQRFMDKVHSRDSSLAKNYEHSWVIMAYLEQYILSRQRQHSGFRDRQSRIQRFVRCPDPLWVRYARAQAEGGPLLRSCQVGRRALKRRVAKKGGRQSGRVTQPRQIRKKCTVGDESSDDEPSYAGTLIADASPPDAVRDFLRSLRPSLEGFYSCFVEMGIKTGDDLADFFSWRSEYQEEFMRKELEQKMNSLQLYGLLSNLRGRGRDVL
ncbi:hypothetical protein F5I97DRAFT_523792 [Phlebopus sp. FC_14]|nr:hypothetical protein F5I97DRAFT_523792 [Phlebopus sp. FC_14]